MGLGGCENPAPGGAAAGIYPVSGLLTHVIFSTVFFPLEKHGKKLILCLEELDHIASNMFLKQSRLGGQPGVPARPDSPLGPGVGPVRAPVRGALRDGEGSCIWVKKNCSPMKRGTYLLLPGGLKEGLQTTPHAIILS